MQEPQKDGTACECPCHGEVAPCRMCSCWSFPLTELKEIARLRLATDEGSLRVRADRMWEVAEAAIKRLSR